MPLVKSSKPGPATTVENPSSAKTHIADLASKDANIRWTAARALAAHPEAVSALAAALTAEESARVREAIMTALMRIGSVR